MKFLKKLMKILRYTICITIANDHRSKKKYFKALEYLQKAEKINPLLSEELLVRSHVYMRLKEFTLSIKDAKSAIKMIKVRKKYSKYDRDYLIYFASRIGITSQCGRDKIEPRFADQEFRKIRYEHIVITNVNKFILRDFPLKSNLDGDMRLFNQ